MREAQGILGNAQRVAVLTGAGMSAESGVPTFRDAQTGLWEKYSPEQLATPEAMANQPDLVWSWLLHQARVMRAVAPHGRTQCSGQVAEKVASPRRCPGYHHSEY